MGSRRIRRDQRQSDMKESRLRNGKLKVKERARRDARMLTMVKGGKLPFIPTIMSWLSTKLDKPSRLITQEEVDQFTKGEAVPA